MRGVNTALVVVVVVVVDDDVDVLP